MLRRVERRALLLALCAPIVGLVVPGGGVETAAGVAGGAVLALGSYWAVRRGIDGLASRLVARSATATPPEAAIPSAGTAETDPPAAARKPKAPRPRGVIVFVLRHALLAGIAYVMIARLRLPPLALLGGASVIMLAVAAEIFRRPGRL